MPNYHEFSTYILLGAGIGELLCQNFSGLVYGVAACVIIHLSANASVGE